MGCGGARKIIGFRRRFVGSNRGPVSAPAALEILYRALVLQRRGTRREGAEVAALAGLRIDLARIEPVLARFELADHEASPRIAGLSTALPVGAPARLRRGKCRLRHVLRPETVAAGDAI